MATHRATHRAAYRVTHRAAHMSTHRAAHRATHRATHRAAHRENVLFYSKDSSGSPGSYGPACTLYCKEESDLSNPCNQQLFCIERPSFGENLQLILCYWILQRNNVCLRIRLKRLKIRWFRGGRINQIILYCITFLWFPHMSLHATICYYFPHFVFLHILCSNAIFSS